MTYAQYAAARDRLAAQQGIPPADVPIPAVLAALNLPAAVQPAPVKECIQMDAPLVSQMQYRANQREALAAPAECVRCGGAIRDPEAARVVYSETGDRAYYWCAACDAALKEELDEAPW